MSVLPMVGYGALAVLVLGWLVVSFSAPSPLRSRIEWLSATAMFLALLCLFANLFSRAREADNLIAMIAFGFLGMVFGLGLVVSTVLTLRSGSDDGVSATN